MDVLVPALSYTSFIHTGFVGRSAMTDRKRVNLTVSPETKDEWDSAVEDSTEYSSLSDLIRQSVAHELAEPPGAATAPEGREAEASVQVEAHVEALEEVTETLANMESTLSNLDNRLTNVEQEVTATAQADLKNQVFGSLPKADSEGGVDGKSAEDIAGEIGAERGRVSNVLTQLEEQTGVVLSVGNIDGQLFYAREEEQ